MNPKLDWLVNVICREFNERISEQNLDESGLFFGEYHRSLEVLRRVYNTFQAHPALLCHWIDEAQIKTPLDFYEPLLKNKYGSEYVKLKDKKWFKECVAGTSELFPIYYLARLCGQEKDSKNETRKKVPVIFIDGFEKLLFRMDYGSYDEKQLGEIRQNVLRGDINLRDKGFGTSLRAALHQAKAGVILGLIRDPHSVEYALTLGNYFYMFYSDNFRHYYVKESE